MKNILLVFVLACFTFVTNGQTDAPDFTVTDMDGVEHNLYSILESNYVVVIDVSATWCAPCWSFHNAHYLKDINEKYGPDGTNQVRVLFYEGDASTTDEDIFGTGNNTKGNWTDGATYPIVNESPVTLDLNIWAPLGFPTISVVRPADKKIIGDLWDYQSGGINAMNDLIESAITVTSTQDFKNTDITIYPNPVSDIVNIDISAMNNEIQEMYLVSITGERLMDIKTNESVIQADISHLNSGVYFVRMISDDSTIYSQKIIKK